MQRLRANLMILLMTKLPKAKDALLGGAAAGSSLPVLYQNGARLVQVVWIQPGVQDHSSCSTASCI